MSNIRPEISKKKKYYISKHRYYELVHFCLQYPEWEREYNDLNFLNSQHSEVRSSDISDPTGMYAVRRAVLEGNMRMVENVARKTRPELAVYIFKAVTEGRSYAYFEARGIPCGKDLFYECRRRFFWLLDSRK